MHIISHARRKARTGAPSGHRGGLYRLMVPLAGLMTAVALMLAPSLASADTASTLTVIGTSDVSDSGLIQNVIGPEFQKASSRSTRSSTSAPRPAPRSTSAKTGTGGAERADRPRPVAGEPVRRRRLLLSTTSLRPTRDLSTTSCSPGPTGGSGRRRHGRAAQHRAGVRDVAAPGASGNATFVSRGGTRRVGNNRRSTRSGPTDEHRRADPDRRVTLCTVPAALGGGMTPIARAPHQRRGLPWQRAAGRPARRAADWYCINSGADAGRRT